MAALNIRPRFALSGHGGNHLELTADTGCRIELFVLADDIIRVLVLPDGELRGPRTWAIAPGMEDTAVDGRERRDMILHSHLNLPSSSSSHPEVLQEDPCQG